MIEDRYVFAEGEGPEYMDPAGAWMDLETGVDPLYSNPEDVTGGLDQPGIPDLPIYTRLDGPWGIPWWDGVEDPTASTGLFSSPNPSYPDEDYGAKPRVGAYNGDYRTLGPVRAWGHEPSGGLGGDQSIGRIMRFPANIPERYDANGVWSIDYLDELAASLAHGGQPIVSNAEFTTSLLLGPPDGDF